MQTNDNPLLEFLKGMFPFESASRRKEIQTDLESFVDLSTD